MKKIVKFVGLDVHKASIRIAVCQPGGGEPSDGGEGPNDFAWLLARLRALTKAGGQLKVCYEAGPTGFGLARQLRKAGIECQVVAPGAVPTRPGEKRIKTDRRDAIKLARALRNGDLIEVAVPTEETEAMRDLERAREDAKNAERAARHQLVKFLLRHDLVYTTGRTWTQQHLNWIRKLTFASPVLAAVRDDYLRAVEDAAARVARLDAQIRQHVETWSRRPLVVAFQALHGIGLLSAVVLAAEIGDFARFSKPSQLMAFLGVVPSEDSSGERRRRGRITRLGNQQVRRILTEAGWCYHRKPRRGKIVQARRKLVSDKVRRIAEKAEDRLWRKYSRLIERKKTKNKVVMAVARELAGFVWAIAQEEDLLAKA
jgi:transposase